MLIRPNLSKENQIQKNITIIFTHVNTAERPSFDGCAEKIDTEWFQIMDAINIINFIFHLTLAVGYSAYLSA